MPDSNSFLTILRRLLIASLAAALALVCVYLELARFNRARSYEHGLAAIEPAREYWPALVDDMNKLRDNVAGQYVNKGSLLDDPRNINAIDLLTIKQRERIVLAGDVKVSVYARVFLRTNNARLIPIPGNTSMLSNDRDLWLPTTVEIIAAEQDILLNDFINNANKAAWEIDPLELESRLNANPGVITCALMVNAPGGYERTLAWLGQILLMLSSFLLIFIPAYVWQDARGRYRYAKLWTLTVALTNIFGLLAYLLFGRVTASVCPECNQAVNEKQKFCPYCRVLLKTECRFCGQPLGRNWSYCSACGAKPEHE